jgi:hypothetical protein
MTFPYILPYNNRDGGGAGEGVIKRHINVFTLHCVCVRVKEYIMFTLSVGNRQNPEIVLSSGIQRNRLFGNPRVIPLSPDLMLVSRSLNPGDGRDMFL